MNGDRFDIAIIGAGIAGASLAAELAPQASVLMLETEDRPGFHATGRSAAFWMESYGGPKVLPLTRASGPWLAQKGFLTPRGGLHIARHEQQGLLDRFERQCGGMGVALERLDATTLGKLFPGLRADWSAGLLEQSTSDIDVGALHGHYLNVARQSGAVLRCRAALATAERREGGWDIRTADGKVARCSILVNAAGAWADEVARIAGMRSIGIRPMRRTMAQLRMERPVPADLPVVMGIDGSFYFKPDAGRLWLTPHDEHLSAPCDAAPEEIDVAIAIDRLEQVVDWPIAALERKWAGLRSFAPDRLPVYGSDVRDPSFFWFAGQGGFGIQTAPAAARLAAQLLLGNGADAMTQALDPEIWSPARLG